MQISESVHLVGQHLDGYEVYIEGRISGQWLAKSIRARDQARPMAPAIKKFEFVWTGLGV